MKTVSEWLSELDTHAIYDADWIMNNFHEETGETADWPVNSYETLVKEIQSRGLEGRLEGGPGDMYCTTQRIAWACYKQYAGGEGAAEFYGRGTQIRAWIAAIKDAGR